MKVAVGIAIGVTLTVTWVQRWRILMSWLLSRGDDL